MKERLMRLEILVSAVLVLSVSGCSGGWQPKPFTLDDMKKLLVSQRGTAWARTYPDSIRDARIGGFHQDWLGNTAICMAMDRKRADGQYAGLRAYDVIIAADHTDVVGAYEATAIEPCDLNGMQAFPELDGAPTKK
jgi:hypothetical protein